MSCKRTNCLYHPAVGLGYNCDYMILTGERRNSPAGWNCDKYKYATPQEQSEIRRKQSNIVLSCEDEGEDINGSL